MSALHPIRVAASAEGGLVQGTLLEAEVERFPLTLGPTETLGDFDFSLGSPPLSVVYGATGYVYFYNADDTTSPDDGLTVLVSADGRRYIQADMSAIAISSVLSIENDPPVSPSAGDAYIVDTVPTGAWAAHAKDIALYTPRGWVFATPKVGCALLNEATGLNVQYSAAGVWDFMATALNVAAVLPELTEFAAGISVEAQQNAPPVSITPDLFYLVGVSPSGAWVGHANDLAVSRDGTTWLFLDAYEGQLIFNKATNAYLTWFDTGAWVAPWPYQATCQFRLTLESGVAISTSDQTAKATLYLTPFRGNAIALYTTGGWVLRTSAEISLSLSGYTTGKCFDIFARDNSGVAAFESLVWTNDTTRATALALQDGVLVKSGDATRRYVGTIYTSATGQCEDSQAKRLVWNYYNRVSRPMVRYETANSWAYSGVVRQANGSTANQLEFVVGVAEEVVAADLLVAANLNTGGNNTAAVGIGLDSTTTFFGSRSGAASSLNPTVLEAHYADTPVAGHHKLCWNEQVAVGSGGSPTFYGDHGDTVLGGTGPVSGLTGSVSG